MKPKIVYFSAQLPSLYVPIAGQKVAWNNLKELSRDYEVILFSFINEKEAPYFKENDYSFCWSTHFYKLNRFHKVRNHLFNIFYPIKVTGRFNKNILNKLAKDIKEQDIKEVFLEFTSSLLYAKELKKLFPFLSIKLVEHDVTYQSFQRHAQAGNLFKRLLFKLEGFRMKKFEIKNLKNLDSVFVLNEKDKSLLEEEGITSVEVLFPKVDDWIYKIERNVEPYTLLFLGAMHRKENQDAVLWFCKDIFPKICDTFPQSKLYIIGGGCSDKIKKLQGKHIEVLGFVKDLSYYFSRTQLAVVPLRFGAGIKIKTLETISAKIPTIATTIGAEGIPENECLFIADSKKEFADKIIQLFKSNNNES